MSSSMMIAFDMIDFKEGKYIPEGLFYTGILTYSNEFDMLKTPNLVTYTFTLEYFNKLQNFEYSSFDNAQWLGDYKQKSDVEALIAGFFEDIIQKFPDDFFANVNESFYHGLLFHVLDLNTKKDSYQVLPEFNLPNGQVDIMLKTYPGAHVPVVLNDLFELKRVPKNATDAELQHKFESGIAKMKEYKSGVYKNWRGVVVCFRGNLDFKIKIV